MEKQVIKQKKPKKKMSKGGLVLLLGCIIILIPCLIFGGILLTASLKTGTPSLGHRFDNDLDPEITKDNTNSLISAIKAISGVEDCSIECTSAQFRINVNTSDSLTSEEIEKLTEDVYNAVNQKLPVSTYFTASGSKKMYDLSINVYNFIEDDNESMIYYILTKNSNMNEYSLQCVSKPLDEELAKELRGELEENVGTGDVQVDGELQDDVTE